MAKRSFTDRYGNTKQFQARLEKPYRLALEQLAKLEGSTQTDVLRKLITKRMKKIDPSWTAAS